MTQHPEQWPKIKDKLRLFVMHVEQERQPPQWLMEFMADGASEFLRGGKPWQKGNGGAPFSDYGRAELEAFILHWAPLLSVPTDTYHRKRTKKCLTIKELVQALGVGDAEGTDRTQTIRRQVKRGEAIVHHAVAGEALREIVAGLIEAEFPDLPRYRRKECRARLRQTLTQLDADQTEPGDG